jgi:hypothetical protein
MLKKNTRLKLFFETSVILTRGTTQIAAGTQPLNGIHQSLCSHAASRETSTGQKPFGAQLAKVFGKRSPSALHQPAALCAVLSCLLFSVIVFILRV